MSPYSDLRGKVAIVTGANGGIGEALVDRLADAGAVVVACSRTITEALTRRWRERAASAQTRILPCPFNLASEELWKPALRAALGEAGEPDILINNAGVAHGGLLSMTSITQLKEVFHVNYFAQLSVIQMVSRSMCRRRRGAIVNVTSIAGLDPNEGNCGYGASKAALGYATSVLAKELAPYAVRVNAVAPGLTQTKMAELMEEKARSAMVNSSAFKRLATPSEIAEAVLFFSSESSGFVTGQVLRVDGGM